MAFKSLEEFLSLFAPYEKQSSGRWGARCKAHIGANDDHPGKHWNLNIWQDGDIIRVKCFANCTREQVAASVGLTWKDLVIESPSKSLPLSQSTTKEKSEIVCTYDYTDENEVVLYQVVRMKPKNFWQRRPDGKGGWIKGLYKDDPAYPNDPSKKKLAVRLVLFHLPKIKKAISEGKAIFVVEGEKDVLNLETLGVYATCNPMGAGKWRPEYNEMLRGANVIIIPDNDQLNEKTGIKAGINHAKQVARNLQGVANSVYMLTLPGGEACKDASIWIEQGGTKEKLLELIDELDEWKPEEEISGGENQSDITINATFIDIPKLSHLGIEALQKANNPPSLFIRSRQLARVNQDEHGLPIIETINEGALRGKLARAARWIRVNAKGNEFPVPPPAEIVRDIFTLEGWPIPPLLGITETPTIREDGSILLEPGYDEKTELYYIPDKKTTVPKVNEIPDEKDIITAKNLLLEVICDFPFQDSASKANAIAAIMTPLLRTLINGPVPLVLFDAPQAGTGKSLLSDITSLIATGRTAAVLTAPSNDDEEWRKSITSLLMLGRNVVTIDNIEGRLSSSSLAAVLTTNNWQDRILGKSEMIVIPHQCSWIGTGNNIQLGGDLPRRCYWVKIDAKNARPWQREGFRHPHLVEWVSKHRGEIIVAALTLARAWLLADKPVPEKLPNIGSFERWCYTLGSILNFIEIPNFLGNLESMYETVDEDTPQWEAFITVWHEMLGPEYKTTSELEYLIRNHEDLKNSLPGDFSRGLDDKNFTHKFGKALSKKTDVMFSDGLFIQKGKTKQRAQTWRIGCRVEGQTNSPNSQLDLNV